MVLEKVKSEFIGTFFLTLGVSLASIQYTTQHIDKLTFATACFLIYAVLLWMGKNNSLSQYNPSITMFLMISGHVEYYTGLSLCIAQIIGALFAAAILKITTPQLILDTIQKNTVLGFPLKNEFNPFRDIVLEAIGSFLVVFAYFMLVIQSKAPKYVYGAGVGAAFFIANIFLIDKTGAGINVARCFALGVMSDFYYHMYVILIGPLLGGILGSIFGSMLLDEKSQKSQVNKTNQNNLQESLQIDRE